MKYLIAVITALLTTMGCSQDLPEERIVTSDITHFWEAYDKINSTTDSTLQYQYLQELYLDKGTPGLTAIRKARRYTPESYITVINSFPLFWQSIREKTLKAKDYAKEIEKGVEQLKAIYPELKPGKVYFEIGAFRTPGTTLDSMVLIGTEMALGDESVNTSEFPEFLEYFKNYLKTNPVKDIVFLNVHEFVHTQQNKHEYVLIYRSVYEGIAEFIAVKATGKASQSAAISYGKTHEKEVKDQFMKELFGGASVINNWLYNSTKNQFGTRDLGYYVGYAIAEGFYGKAKDKKLAIADLIELDYNNEDSFNSLVDKSGYFPKPMVTLKKEYLSNIPEVISIDEFKNGDQDVDSDITKVTINFSKKMDTNNRGFDYGPLGEEHVLSIQNYLGFSDDGKSVSFEVSLEPGKRYQMTLTDKFSSSYGVRMNPYVIDIMTGE